jgi:hypothetical protein
MNMKSMTRCPNGHYYDPDFHSSCPFCGVQGLDVDIEKTRAKRPGTPDEELGATRASRGMPADDEGKTVGIFVKKLGVEPVAGWLVAISGPGKGNDYRIVSDRNYIGRSNKMDVVIKGDETISRESHAIISYNPKKQTFRLLPGESKRLTHLNDEEVIEPVRLKPYDVIELGQTKLMFIPFCSDKFSWDQVEDQ